MILTLFLLNLSVVFDLVEHSLVLEGYLHLFLASSFYVKQRPLGYFLWTAQGRSAFSGFMSLGEGAEFASSITGDGLNKL